MKTRTIFMGFQFVAQIATLQAQDFPYLRFSHLTTKDGLSTNQVSCAYRDTHGIMWFGTLKGLNRYDGRSFKVFLHNRDDKYSLPNNHIVKIAEDKQGMLWLDANGVLCRFDPSKEKIIQVVPAESFNSFMMDSEDRIWIVFDEVARQYDYSANTFIDYLLPVGEKHEKPLRFLTVYEDRDKNIWLTSTWGLFKVETNQKKLQRYASAVFTPFNLLYQDDQKNFWAAFWKDGLKKISISENKIMAAGFHDTTCMSIDEWTNDAGNHFLIITFDGGIAMLDTKTGHIRRYSHDRRFPEENNISTFPQIYKDKEGRAWITHTNGVDIIDPYLQGVMNVHLDADEKNKPGVTFGNPRSFFETPDEYWISSSAQKGISIYSRRWELKKNLVNIPVKNSPFSEDVIAVSEDQEGDLWYGTPNGLIREQKGKYDSPVARGNFTSSVSFGNILPAGGQLYWARSPDEGVFLLNTKNSRLVRRYAHGDSSSGNIMTGPYMKMFFDYDKKLWLTGFNGLSYYDSSSGKFISIPVSTPTHPAEGFPFVMDAIPDSNHLIWLITHESFGKFNTQTGSITFYNTSNGFTGNGLVNIAKDDYGNIWIKTVTELIRFHVASGVFNYYNEQSGLPVDNWKGQSLMTNLSNGDILIGGDNILTELNPAVLLHNNTAPAVYIEDIDINNKRADILTDTGGKKTVVLLPGQRNISAHFGVFNYTSPQGNKFYYKIDELDEDWHQSIDGNLSYNNLRPGTYHLHMTGRNSNGILNNEGDLLVITVKPFFYQTSTFYILCLLVLAGLLYLVYRNRINSFRHKEQLRSRYNQLVAEMEVKALRSQMNPHFIFNSLNAINRYILKSERNQASSYLTKFSKLIRLILENSRQSKIPLSSELDALELYLELESLRFQENFHYQIHVDDDISPASIFVPPMIIQPFVENSIWHGLLPKEHDCELTIHFRGNGGHLICVIEDNGIGRKRSAELKQQQSTGRTSLGMSATEQRLQLMTEKTRKMASIDVEDLVGSNGVAMGTRVTIHIPYNFNSTT